MTKLELIDKYGIEWYEWHKERCRKYVKAKYDANPEAERERSRKKRADHPEVSRRYSKKHREVYRINARDSNRLRKLRGMNLDGMEIHHMKYHKDNKDASWIDDIVIMTREEHLQWHRDHPDFVAEENVV